MRALATPFGREPGGIAAPWPAAGRSRAASKLNRWVDPWFDPPRCQDGETVLIDLETAGTPADAARVLVRYFAVRLLRAALGASPGFMPEVERAAARSWLRSLPRDDPDRLALAPFVEGPVPELTGDHFAGRLEAAASTSAGRQLRHSTFALLHAGYDLARAARQYADAARIARQLASFASARDATHAARRWKLRAHANERHAAAARKQT